jgi:hypothetical protein
MYVIAPDGKILYSYVDSNPVKHVENTLALKRPSLAKMRLFGTSAWPGKALGWGSARTHPVAAANRVSARVASALDGKDEAGQVAELQRA